MDKQKISDLIYENLNSVYCNNCRYASELDEDELGDNFCEDCYRKYMGWAISRSESDWLAEKIVNIKD